jgi:hypothetical protein
VRLPGFWLSAAALFLMSLTGCQAQPVLPTATALPTSALSAAPSAVQEYPVQLIPLAAPLDQPQVEISGMAWLDDKLVLLPQYPQRYQNQLFALPKNALEAFLDGEQTEPLIPQSIPFDSAGLESSIPGFEGFEALAFSDDQVFMTIEARQGGMRGYLAVGTVAPVQDKIILDGRILELASQTGLENYSDEAIVIYAGQVLTIHEANGAAVNPSPAVYCFDLTGSLLDPLPFPNIEYRITDAAPPDSHGLFWAINYLFPPDAAKLKPAPDHLAETFGEGPTHQQFETVERLLALQITTQGITLADLPPVQLQLLGDDSSRNWEALAYLDGRGFLLATDKFPQTLLGFVAWP